jgi:hypothetical protein
LVEETTNGIKTKEITKKVIINPSNLINSTKKELAVFSNFPIDEENSTITLKDNYTDLYFFITTNNENAFYYVADFNTNYDSNLD